MSQLVGLFQDPATGMVCLFKEEMVSFVHPVSPVDCLSFEPLQEVSLPGKNTHTLSSICGSIQPHAEYFGIFT